MADATALANILQENGGFRIFWAGPGMAGGNDHEALVIFPACGSGAELAEMFQKITGTTQTHQPQTIPSINPQVQGDMRLRGGPFTNNGKFYDPPHSVLITPSIVDEQPSITDSEGYRSFSPEQQRMIQQALGLNGEPAPQLSEDYQGPPACNLSARQLHQGRTMG